MCSWAVSISLKMRRLASADAPSQSLEVWGLSTLVVGRWVYVPSGMCSFGRQAMPCPALTLACALSGARLCPVLPSRWVLSCPDVRCCRACTTHSVQPLNHSHTRAHTHTHAGTGISGALQLGGGRVGGGGEHDHAPRCLPPPPPPHPNRRCQNVCCRRYIFFLFLRFLLFLVCPSFLCPSCLFPSAVITPPLLLLLLTHTHTPGMTGAELVEYEEGFERNQTSTIESYNLV